MQNLKSLAFALLATTLACAAASPSSQPSQPETGRQQTKPNILVIWGDDIGYWNVSAYNQGMMGYKTPNIDRIAKEGALFTDWYGQQSCTAGRACFITGQAGFRTGLLKVGLPGAKEGLQARDVTIAELLKAPGLRDRPVRQEPPRRPRRAPADGARLRRVLRLALPPQRRGGAGESRLLQGPGAAARSTARAACIHSWANPDGTQKIESTGPLTKKRMETVRRGVHHAKRCAS